MSQKEGKHTHNIFERTKARSPFRSWIAGHAFRLNSLAGNLRSIEEDSEAQPPCEDEPCTFSNDAVRTYFTEIYSLKQKDRDPYIYVAYSCIFGPSEAYGTNTFIIVLISGDLLAAGCFNNGTHVGSFQKMVLNNPSKSNSRELPIISTINSYIEEWAGDRDRTHILIRSPEVFKEPLKSLGYRVNHIPFKTAKPSIVEIKRVFEKLSTVRKFYTYQEALDELRSYRLNQRTQKQEDSDITVKPSKAAKNAKKQMFSDIDKKTQNKLINAIKVDDENLIFEMVHHHGPQTLDFFNSTHSDLDELTFLHYAAKHGIKNSLQVLLDFGCDICAHDKHFKLPYEYCFDDETRQIFIDFRTDHPDAFNWNKTGVPQLLLVYTPAGNEETDEKPQYSVKNRKHKERQNIKTELRRSFQKE